MINNTLNWTEFSKVDMRIGTILTTEIFKEAKNAAYILTIDFGDLGIKKTSAQLTSLYKPNDLIGKQIVAVVNFPPKQIANIMSECLVLGGLGDNKEVVILQPEQHMKNGTKIA